MKIGIIGAGHIGGTLTRRLKALGHDVSVANSRGPDTLADLARESGATAVEVEDAIRGKDVVIVSIPEKAVPELPKNLFAGAKDTVVVDTGNYYPKQRDGRIAEIEGDQLTESQWVSEQLGHPVVKVFNTIYAKHLMENGRPRGDEHRIALPIAGDDHKAKLVVMQLVDELGFDPVDAGGLGDSWRQQPGTPVYGADLAADKLKKALADTPHERPKDFCA